MLYNINHKNITILLFFIFYLFIILIVPNSAVANQNINNNISMVYLVDELNEPLENVIVEYYDNDNNIKITRTNGNGYAQILANKQLIKFHKIYDNNYLYYFPISSRSINDMDLNKSNIPENNYIILSDINQNIIKYKMKKILLNYNIEKYSNLFLSSFNNKIIVNFLNNDHGLNENNAIHNQLLIKIEKIYDNINNKIYIYKTNGTFNRETQIISYTLENFPPGIYKILLRPISSEKKYSNIESLYLYNIQHPSMIGYVSSTESDYTLSIVVDEQGKIYKYNDNNTCTYYQQGENELEVYYQIKKITIPQTGGGIVRPSLYNKDLQNSYFYLDQNDYIIINKTDLCEKPIKNTILALYNKTTNNWIRILPTSNISDNEYNQLYNKPFTNIIKISDNNQNNILKTNTQNFINGYSLYDINNINIHGYPLNEIITKYGWMTTVEPIKINNIPNGFYELYELLPNYKYYTLSNKLKTFYIQNIINNEQNNVSVPHYINIQNNTTSIIINKIDNITKQNIQGAEIGLYKKIIQDNQIIYKNIDLTKYVNNNTNIKYSSENGSYFITSNIPTILIGLPIGEYKIIELKPPKGYDQLNYDFIVNIKPVPIPQKINIENTKTPPVEIDKITIPLEINLIKNINNMNLTTNSPNFIFELHELDNNLNNLGIIQTAQTNYKNSMATFTKQYNGKQLGLSIDKPITYKLYKIIEQRNPNYELDDTKLQYNQQLSKYNITEDFYNKNKGYYAIVKFELINNKITTKTWYTTFPIMLNNAIDILSDETNNITETKLSYNEYSKPHVINNITKKSQSIIMPETGSNNYIIMLFINMIIIIFIIVTQYQKKLLIKQ